MAQGRAVWYSERLWELSKNLPVQSVLIESIREFDQNCWFDEETLPTCKNVAAHARRIFEVDLSYPVILSADGGLMDGGHRLYKPDAGRDTYRRRTVPRRPRAGLHRAVE